MGPLLVDSIHTEIQVSFSLSLSLSLYTGIYVHAYRHTCIHTETQKRDKVVAEGGQRVKTSVFLMCS